MTSFPKGSVENPSISEDFPNITGSVPQMIQATMERFRNLFIREKVIKVPNQMEALRIFNYPYQASEEAVVNAFYHRDYMSYEPVTIEIEPDCINIMNFPGIDRSISEKTITEGKRFVSRYYRNRRLGEFLKELELSEGHSSGIPTIQEELERNGSPRAEFFTDEDRRTMRIRIPIQPTFLEIEDEVVDSHEKAMNKLSEKKAEQYAVILKVMSDREWHKTSEIADKLGLKDTRTKELLKEMVAIDKLVDNGKTKGKMYRIKRNVLRDELAYYISDNSEELRADNDTTAKSYQDMASAYLGKFASKDVGWLEEEFDESTFEKYIVITEQGVMLAELLIRLERPEREELSSYIHNTLLNQDQWND